MHPRTIAVKYQSGQKRCCRLRRQPGKKERNSMLIVALQDDVDNLYAIWNTVSDRFLGVNLRRLILVLLRMVRLTQTGLCKSQTIWMMIPYHSIRK